MQWEKSGSPESRCPEVRRDLASKWVDEPPDKQHKHTTMPSTANWADDDQPRGKKRKHATIRGTRTTKSQPADAWVDEPDTSSTSRRPPREAVAIRFSSAMLRNVQGMTSKRNSVEGPAVYTKSAKAGQDPKRIIARLKGEGRCECTAKRGLPPCHKHHRLQLSTLQNFCYVFHRMSEIEQWSLMRLAHGGDESETNRKSRRTDWYIGDTKTCFSNFAHLISKGRTTLRKWLKNTIEDHNIEAPDRGRPNNTRPQGEICDFFFKETYDSSAEPLAEAHKSVQSRCMYKQKSSGETLWIMKAEDDDDDKDIFYDCEKQGERQQDDIVYVGGKALEIMQDEEEEEEQGLLLTNMTLLICLRGGGSDHRSICIAEETICIRYYVDVVAT